MKTDEKVFTFRVPVGVLKRAQDKSAEQDQSLAQIMRRLINEWLDKNRD